MSKERIIKVKETIQSQKNNIKTLTFAIKDTKQCYVDIKRGKNKNHNDSLFELAEKLGNYKDALPQAKCFLKELKDTLKSDKEHTKYIRKTVKERK